VVCYFRDISNIVHARESILALNQQLMVSRERFRRVLDTEAVGLLFFNYDGVVIDANEPFLKMTGYTRSEVEKRELDWRRMTPPEWVRASEEQMEKLAATGRIGPYEKEYICQDGSRRWMLFTGRDLGDGTIAEYCFDISDRKRAETAVRESESRYHFIADRAQVGYWHWDLASDRLEWSALCKKMFGIPEDEPMSYERFLAALHPDDRARAEQAVREHLEGGGATHEYNIEFRSVWPDGTTHWILSKGSATFENGKPLRMAGIALDISDRKRIEEDLRAANSDLEQFAYSVSHDLQEPMRTLKIYTQLLGRRYGEKLQGEAQTFLNHIQQGASRMEMLLRDLLTYTRTTRLAPGQPADVGTAIQTALDNLGAAIADTRALITFEPMPSVPVHATQLQQLFQNLVGNAIKYHRPGVAPVVHVAVKRLDHRWLFSIADNGIGIEPEYRENIFGLFKRLHSADRYSGTGIGLALCQRVVELYHGRIWVESELGKGSTFYFTLPA
jgi:PAS domain S-box-containing protein